MIILFGEVKIKCSLTMAAIERILQNIPERPITPPYIIRDPESSPPKLKRVNVFNSNLHLIDVDPFKFYNGLKIEDDASHAFYMGVELARAQIAWELGKDYDQDNELQWGVASKSPVKNLNKRPKPKSTQRKK